MADLAVVNASPIICLSRIDRFDLLKFAGDEIVVPRVVANEINVRGADDPAVLALGTCQWLKVVHTPPTPATVETWDLGRASLR